MVVDSRLGAELIVGALVVLLLGFLGWCALARRLRARAWGGVSGREGRGWLSRDGDELVFVRRGRRYLLSMHPQPHQAVRRYRRSENSPLVSGYVFRDSRHVTHTVAFADARVGAPVLTAPREAVPRFGFRVLVPRATMALGLIMVPVLDQVVRPVQTPTVISWTDVVVGVCVVVILAAVLVMAALAAHRPSVILSPVLVQVPGFDGSMPRDERYRAERMPLHDLAVAVQQAEGQRDVEDNDQLLAPLRGLVRSWRAALVVRVLLTLGTLWIAVKAASFWPLVVVVLMLVVTVGGVVRHPGLRALRNARNTSRPVHWREWPLAALWRRLDGAVFLGLFDRGGLVWLIPVDRVCAAGADIELSGDIGVNRTPAIRANGAWLLALGPPRHVGEWDAKRMRRELVDSLTTPASRKPVRP